MGVFGATSCFRQEDLFRQKTYSNITVLVDASGLYFKLLNHTIEQEKNEKYSGGNYSSFKQRIVECFDKLFKCKIIPIVVLDGATPLIKFSTKLKRFIKQLPNNESLNDNSNDHFFHHLTREVFVNTLQRINVQMIQAPYEADDILAFLSYRFELPIFSGDSDFFFYRHPVLSIVDWIENDVIPKDEGDGDAEFCIPISTILPIDIREHYKIPNEALLQLAPLLIGNDYIPPLVGYFSNWRFFRHIPEPKSNFQCVNAILHWVGSIRSSDFDTVNRKFHEIINPKYSVEAVKFVNRMRELSFVHLYDFPSGYHPSNSMLFMTSEKFNAWYNRALIRLYSEKFPFSILPEKISDRELNIVLTQTDWQRPIPEYYEELSSSAFECGNDLAEIIYNCLLDEEQNITLIETCVDAPGSCKIIERKRMIFNSQKQDWQNMSEKERINKLLIMVGIFPQHIETLESFFKCCKARFIVVAMLVFRRSSKVCSQFIEALLICLFIREQFQGPEDEEFYKAWKDNINYCVADSKKLSKDSLHYYNQFQVILSSMICLTRIMYLPNWNPSDLLERLEGDFIGKLFVAGKMSLSRSVIDKIFERFSNLKKIYDYIMTSV